MMEMLSVGHAIFFVLGWGVGCLMTAFVYFILGDGGWW